MDFVSSSDSCEFWWVLPRYFDILVSFLNTTWSLPKSFHLHPVFSYYMCDHWCGFWWGILGFLKLQRHCNGQKKIGASISSLTPRWYASGGDTTTSRTRTRRWTQYRTFKESYSRWEWIYLSTKSIVYQSISITFWSDRNVESRCLENTAWNYVGKITRQNTSVGLSLEAWWFPAFPYSWGHPSASTNDKVL